MNDDDYILEFIAQGRFVKVTAVDPVTGTEAVIIGDSRESKQVLGEEAVKKLEYIMKK